MALILLFVTGLVLVPLTRRNRGGMNSILEFPAGHWLANPYYRGAVEILLGCGLPALVGMALLWRNPVEFAPEFTFAPALPHYPTSYALWSLIIPATMAIGIGLAFRRRGVPVPKLVISNLPPPTRLRDAPPLLAMTMSAGICEELCYRQFLPLLIILASNDLTYLINRWIMPIPPIDHGVVILIAITASSIAFGLAHRYKPWIRCLVGFLGFWISWVYLLNGQLWLVMLIHAVVNLVGLSIGPIANWPRVARTN